MVARLAHFSLKSFLRQFGLAAIQPQVFCFNNNAAKGNELSVSTGRENPDESGRSFLRVQSQTVFLAICTGGFPTVTYLGIVSRSVDRRCTISSAAIRIGSAMRNRPCTSTSYRKQSRPTLLAEEPRLARRNSGNHATSRAEKRRSDGSLPVAIGGAFATPPQSGLTWLCFLFPLIEPDRRISRIRLSEKTHT